MTVAEAVLNLACVGARPLAVVNCLNFGNPEHPEVMWQLSEAIDGMAEACRALDVPVVGGNVSLYNESRGRDIDPTPVVGVLGIVDELEARPPGLVFAEGDRLLLFGPPADQLGGSTWLRRRGGWMGELPPIDLAMHAAVADVVRRLVAGGLVSAAHDVSVGGLGAALGEMVVASGIGARVARVADHGALFSEGASRVILAVDPETLGPVEAVATAAGVPVTRLGLAGGDQLAIKGLVDVDVSRLTASAAGRLPDALGSGTAQG